SVTQEIIAPSTPLSLGNSLLADFLSLPVTFQQAMAVFLSATPLPLVLALPLPPTFIDFSAAALVSSYSLGDHVTRFFDEAAGAMYSTNATTNSMVTRVALYTEYLLGAGQLEPLVKIANRLEITSHPLQVMTPHSTPMDLLAIDLGMSVQNLKEGPVLMYGK